MSEVNVSKFIASFGFKVDKNSYDGVIKKLKAVETRALEVKKKVEQSFIIKLNTGTVNKQLTSLTKKLEKLHMQIGPTQVNSIHLYEAAWKRLENTFIGINANIPRLPRSIHEPNFRQGSTIGRGGNGLMSLLGGFVGGWGGWALALGMGNFEFGHMLREGIKTARELQSNERSLQVTTGSDKKGKAEYAYAVDFAQKYGIDVETATSQYARIMGASEGTAAAPYGRGIFEAFSKYAVAQHLSENKQKGILYAVSEMMGYGQVYKRQLQMIATRAPHFDKILADAVAGGSVQKLFEMTKSGLPSENIWPKLIELLNKESGKGGALQNYLEGSQAQEARFKNTWKNFAKDLYENGQLDNALGRILRILVDISTAAMNVVKTLAPPILGAIADAADAVHGTFKNLWDVLTGVYDILGDEWKNNKIMFFLTMISGGIVAANLIGWTRLGTTMGVVARSILTTWAPIIAMFLIISDVLAALNGRGSFIGGYNKQKPWLQDTNNRLVDTTGFSNTPVYKAISGDTAGAASDLKKKTWKDWLGLHHLNDASPTMPSFIKTPPHAAANQSPITIHQNVTVHGTDDKQIYQTILKASTDALQLHVNSVVMNNPARGR